MNKLSLIELRDQTASDMPFIYSTWIKGLRHGNDFYGEIDEGGLREGQKVVIDRLIDSGTVTIAALKEDNDVVLGYSVTRDSIIDWVFVKQLWRNLGIAKLLLGHIKPEICSHITYLGNDIRKKHGITFNPFK